LLAKDALPELEVQVIQAPVFHGYAASVLVELERAVTAKEVEAALEEEPFEVASVEPPSNLSATGQQKVMVRVNSDGKKASTRTWLWIAVDNLKLAAMNAISCAVELSRLRPSGNVQ
jgi:aspartate-semialdehyde dehydrogenase